MSLLLMQRQIGEGKRRLRYLSIASDLINDVDNDCRWQAMIVIAEFMESEPEWVWKIVEEFGQSEDSDMRAAVATVLLEHLLEKHPRKFRRRANVLAGQSERFANTLRTCWSLPHANARD